MSSITGGRPRADARDAIRTFLIADIRGYTQFTQDHGDEAAARLATKFAEIAGEGVEAHGGEVVELRGDEVLAVFTSARAALRAAGELQQAFDDEAEDDPQLPLRVGIGLDAGEAVRVGDGYRGGALNLAARLCSRAAAGEVLASQGVVHLARTVTGLRYEPVDPVELKGYAEPVTALRLVFDSRERISFEAPVGQRTELPPELDPVTPLVGRDRDLRWLRWAWRRARHGSGRVLALSGPEGIGKTRLAAELAREVHAEGRPVAYARCAGPAADALRTLQGAQPLPGPTLVIADDVDLAAGTVGDAVDVLISSAPERPLLVVVTHRDRTAPMVRAMLDRAKLTEDRRRILEPLDGAGVRALAALYVDEEETGPPQEFMDQAGGVPGLVHRVAAEWASRDAATRLDGSLGRAARGRSRFLAAQEELATNVVDLRAARERVSLYTVGQPTEGPTPAVCPYKGLAPFQPADAEYFFGRERLVAELVARLVGSGFLGVVGPSGSGKSSAVRAGLLPSLSSGVIPGSEGWIQAVMRPGEHPRAELERTLATSTKLARDDRADTSLLRSASAALDPGKRLVLLVDQFEEVFTACRDESERSAFLEEITTPASRAEENVIVVVAIRADFYGRCALHARLAHLLGENHVLVGPMQQDELRRSVELPARRAGLRVDPELVEAIVSEVKDQPGGLPLLSSALLELWQRRDGRSLTMDAYRQSGGVQGAVGRLAEEAYGRLSPEQQRHARRILLRLAGSGDGEAVVRRRVALEEFDLDQDQDAARVVSVLTEARLLTASKESVEVAHEALLREWPRLRSWLEEDVQGRRLHLRVIEAATEWQRGERDSAYLFRGARLATALDWTTHHTEALNDLERDFLEESRAAWEREAQRARRTNRRLRGSLVGIALFLALSLVAGALFLVQRGRAQRQATVAEAQRLAVQAVGQDHLDLGLLLAREAVNLDDSVETRGALLTTLLRSPQAIGFLHVGEAVADLAVTPRGQTLAVSDEAGHITLFDTRTRERSGAFSVPGMSLMVRSPDGRTLAVGVQGTHGGKVQLWDVQTTRERREIATPGSNLSSVAFSPDGQTLGAVVDRSVFLWETRTGERLGPTLHLGGGRIDQRWALSFTPDGRKLVTTQDTPGRHAAGKRTILWDLRTHKAVRTYGFGGAMTLAPNGRTVALLNDVVTLLDLASGRVRTLPRGGHRPGYVLAFSPDGRTLAASTQDGPIVEWDVPSATVKEVLTGPVVVVSALAFSQDGNTLYGGAGSSVVAWDTGGRRRLGRLFAFPPTSRGFAPVFAFSPAGSQLAVSSGSDVVMYDLQTVSAVRTLSGLAPRGVPIIKLAFSPDGKRLAVSTFERSVLLDPRSGAVTERMGRFSALGWSADGSSLWGERFTRSVQRGSSFIGLDRLVRRDGRTGARVPAPRIGEYTSLFVSPDGTRVGGVGLSGRIGVWDLHGPRRLSTIQAPVLATAVLSEHGDVLAATGTNDRVLLWDLPSGRRLGKPLSGPAGMVPIAFDPGGTLLLTASGNGAVQLWDVSSHRQLAAFPPPSAGISVQTAFSPDGAHLLVLYSDGRGYVWDIDPAHWAAKACEVAGRNLTPSEWKEFLPDRPYQPVCSGQPQS